MPKIHFEGNPPRMDFNLVKNHTGVTLIDVPSKQIHSLGEGELASLIGDASNSLRRTLEATLKGMEPAQSIKVQIFVHPTGGYGYTDFGYPGGFPPLGDQMNFVFGSEPKASRATIKPITGKVGQNEVNEVKKIIIVGQGNVVPGQPDLSNVRHPQTENDDNGADIVELN